MKAFFNLGWVLSCLLMSASLNASSFLVPPFSQTVQEAPIIVRGTIESQYTDWGEDSNGNKNIYTYYVMQISQGIKGGSWDSTQKNLTLRELGGEKDGVRYHVPGVSEYAVGEDVVVFLKEVNSQQSHDVFGMMMGKYTIRINEAGEEILEGASFSDQNPPQSFKQLQQLVAQLKDQAPRASDSSTAPPLTSLKTLSSPLQLPATERSLEISNLARQKRRVSLFLWIGGGLFFGMIGWILWKKKSHVPPASS